MKRFPRHGTLDAGLDYSCVPLLPVTLNLHLRERLASCVTASLNVGRRELLACRGDPFRHLYLIVQGAFKTVQADDVTYETGQIVSFQWPRELLGMDGFATRFHATDLVALEPSMLYEFPVAAIEALAESDVELLDHLLAYVADELTHAERLQHVLGSMSAAQRIAFFFLNLPGQALSDTVESSSLDLPMTRAEIGNYLGLSMETVSRLVSKLRGLGAIEIGRKKVRILCRELLLRWQTEVQESTGPA